MIDRKTLYITDIKPTKFTTDVWLRSYALNGIVGPSSDDHQKNAQFNCDHGTCHAQKDGGLKIAVIEKQNSNNLSCPDDDILVLSTNVHVINCRPEQKVITATSLKLKGSMVVTDNGKIISSIESGPTRPWNEHRKYLRSSGSDF